MIDIEATPRQISAPELQTPSSLNILHVNERVFIRDDSEAPWRVVSVSGVPLFRYHRDDRQSQRVACVALHMGGQATQAEVARAFGHSRATQCRWEEAYRLDGVSGLTPYRPDGRPVSVSRSVEDEAAALHAQGLGMKRIAECLGLSLNVVRGIYQRRGLEPHIPKQLDLLEPTGALAEEVHEASPGGPMARTGEVEGGAIQGGSAVEGEGDEPIVWPTEPWDGLLVPEYETAAGVPWAGVLLAIPVMRGHRVLEVFSEVYRTLGLLAFYGLQTVVTLMVFLALWRIKRPEQLKGHSPGDLGRPLGLGRVPEVKTVRRKLARLADVGAAREAMLRLAKIRVEQEEELLGYLYVDGHVRPYGGQYDLAKGYSMLRHMPVRATTDTWVNDSRGDPLFMVTSEINEALTQTLEPVLEQARDLIGDDRSVTVVFDRGGYSPHLFVRLMEAGYDIITYRKGKNREVAAEDFEKRVIVVEGKRYTYHLNDQKEVRVGSQRIEWSDGQERFLTMRQVTRLKPENGHQTAVLTTRTGLEPEQVLWRMFNRWRQENFFKYMLEEFAIDGLVEYGCEGVDPKLERPNPVHHALTKEIENVHDRLTVLQSRRCSLIGEVSTAPETRGGFERFMPNLYDADKLLGEIRGLGEHLQELEARRADTPERISAGDLERLKTERHQVATVFKVAAYNIETELVRMVAPYYARTELEGRKLIAAAIRSSADLEVRGNELRVTLAPQSSPHRSRAIAALCASLNNTAAVVPGTGLRLVLDCALETPENASS